MRLRRLLTSEAWDDRLLDQSEVMYRPSVLLQNIDRLLRKCVSMRKSTGNQ